MIAHAYKERDEETNSLIQGLNIHLEGKRSVTGTYASPMTARRNLTAFLVTTIRERGVASWILHDFNDTAKESDTLTDDRGRAILRRTRTSNYAAHTPGIPTYQ